MKALETIGRALRFDEPDGRFELLEAEPGEPSFFHGRKRSPVPETPDGRTVPKGLRESRRRLETAGCLGASMSGSGATVFGIARDAAEAGRIARTLEAEGLWSVAVETVR